eukprot:TRINITY_DN7570_c0_g1_i2.p1 TRINITY_DN7570_c0_g1~~TRINITY_DN7570_c0_g1_i2.p1  ORF type:complete len:410 (-),score=41.18 TRINITY_DN7570_c0_g1_i2:537-1745(-)
MHRYATGSDDDEDVRDKLRKSVSTTHVDRWGLESVPTNTPAATSWSRAYDSEYASRTVERRRELERHTVSNVLPSRRRIREDSPTFWQGMSEYVFGPDEDLDEAFAEKFYSPSPLPPPARIPKPIWLDESESEPDEPMPEPQQTTRHHAACLPLPPTVQWCELTGKAIEGGLLRAEYEIDWAGPEGDCLIRWFRGNQYVEFPGAIYPLSHKDVGHVITFEVTPIGDSGMPGSSVTATSAKVMPAPVRVVEPPPPPPPPPVRKEPPARVREEPAVAAQPQNAIVEASLVIKNCFCGAVISVEGKGIDDSQCEFQWSRARFPFKDSTQWFSISGYIGSHHPCVQGQLAVLPVDDGGSQPPSVLHHHNAQPNARARDAFLPTSSRGKANPSNSSSPRVCQVHAAK